MRQLTRLLAFQNRRCAVCNKRIKEDAASVMRIDPEGGGRSDANSFAVCRETAEYVSDLPLKERIFTFLHPPEDLPCFPEYPVEEPTEVLPPSPPSPQQVRRPEANAMLTHHVTPLPVPYGKRSAPHTNSYAPKLARSTHSSGSVRAVSGASSEPFVVCPRCSGTGGMNGGCPRCAGHGYLKD